MVVVHRRRGEGRTPTGGRTTIVRSKRRFEVGSKPTETRLDTKTKVIVENTKFGHIKSRVLTANQVNLFDPKNKSFSQTTIKAVLESTANRQYVRRNIIVKGVVIDTEKGKAKVTSRPGQDGTVNAVLI